MEISQNTAIAINRYFRKLVRRQPGWLKDLFDTDRVVFAIDINGMLGLEIDEELSDEIKESARHLIHKYISTHPPKFILTKEVIH